VSGRALYAPDLAHMRGGRVGAKLSEAAAGRWRACSMARRLEGHGKRGRGKGHAPDKQGGTDYRMDREAGRVKRCCVVLLKTGPER
jgi:hypothetical protein